MTMEFLGYTHVRPVRRQWEIPVQTPGQYRYNPPGGGSANLEEITFYLRYLIALPTLRLALDNRSAGFLDHTAPRRVPQRTSLSCRRSLTSALTGGQEDGRTSKLRVHCQCIINHAVPLDSN